MDDSQGVSSTLRPTIFLQQWQGPEKKKLHLTYPIELGRCYYFIEIFFSNIPIIKTKLLFVITSSMRKS